MVTTIPAVRAAILILSGLSLTYSADLRAATSSCAQQAESAPELALATAAQRLAQNPEDVQVFACRAMAHFTLGDFAAAAGDFTRAAIATKDATEAARLHNHAGWALARSDDRTQAGKAFAMAIRLRPQEAGYWQDHAMVLMQNEQYWDAQRELDYALKLAPKQAALWGLRAEVWRKLGMSAKARSDAQMALSLQPDEIMAQSVLGMSSIER
jgi:Flp pilus assembly protein TadD